MTSLFFKRLLTPGALPEDKVLIFGIIALMALSIADWALGSDILLPGVYVFPLAVIVLHCQQKIRALLVFVLTAGLQCFAILFESIPVVTKITDALVALASSTLVLSLARVARHSYLETVQLATHDSLTGLHNRRSFDSIYEPEFARQSRYGGMLSLVIVDLDHFKELNDSKGHKAGDAALILLADVLRDCTRKSDVAARLGGDEFAILMPNCPREDCDSLCQNLLAEIARRMANSDFAITASIGSITFEQAPESVMAACEMADKAMYEAKARGGNYAVSL